MCVVSMIGDHYNDKFDPLRQYMQQGIASTLNYGVSQAEFDKLKKEVEEMKALLKRAKLYDEANNELNCEMEEKVKFLKQIAEAVGVDLSEIFGKKES